jgi:tetratricopeptide (TPR) repeat protein
MISTKYIPVIFTALTLLVSGCASTGSGSRSSAASNAPVSGAAARQYKSALSAMKKKNYQLALKKFKTLAVKYPSFAGPKANIGIIYSRKGKYKKAKKAFESAIAINSSNPVIYNELGVLYRRMGKFSESKDAYKKALSINSDYAYAHLNLGILYDLYLRKPGKALGHYQHYQKVVKSDKLVNKWIAELKLRIRRNDKIAQR